MQQDIEHPENDACYEGLAVNKGIEQPDPVTKASKEKNFICRRVHYRYS